MDRVFPINPLIVYTVPACTYTRDYFTDISLKYTLKWF